MWMIKLYVQDILKSVSIKFANTQTLNSRLLLKLWQVFFHEQNSYFGLPEKQANFLLSLKH